MDQWVRNYKNITVKMTDGSILKGKINIGETKRLSLLFKILQEKFITLVPEEADEASKENVIIINKDYIVWVKSED